MTYYKYGVFVILVVLMTGGISPEGGIPSAYGLPLSATDTIAPEEDVRLPFGDVAVGKTSFSETVVVHNQTNFPVSISGIQLTGPHKNAFQVKLNDGPAPCGNAMPRNIPAGRSCTLSVLFNPGAAGLQSAFLDISLVNTIEEKIAFQDAGTNGISLYDVETKIVTPLTNPGVDQEDRNPSWSPTGRQVVFNRHNLIDVSDNILLKNIDGLEENLLVARIGTGGTMPAWSPDGKTLVFRDERLGGISFWNFSQNIISFGSEVSGKLFNPSWAPSGRELVFQRTTSQGAKKPTKDIFKLVIDSKDFNNSIEEKIIPNGRTPAWSPDGARIAYYSNITKGISLHTLSTPSNRELTSPSPLLGNRDFHPSWSPDGNRLVFYRTNSDEFIRSSSDELFIINVAGGPPTLISPKGRNPAWSPQLSNLAIALSGTGLSATTNSPPSAPQLISPDNGARVISTNVVFRWLDGIDPDGDPVSHDLHVCEDEQFTSGCRTSNNVAKLDRQTVFFAGLGTAGGSTLLLFGVGVVFLKRRNQAFGSFLIVGIITTTLLVGCGGGGGSTRVSAGEKNEITEEITGLTAGTVYFWKVIARDDQGGKTSSLVRRFTTG